MKIVEDVARIDTGSSPEAIADVFGNLLATGRKYLVATHSCDQCGKIVGFSFVDDSGQATQLILRECTRIILGLHPNVGEVKYAAHSSSNFCFICRQCNAQIPEMVAKAMPELKGRLGCNPIIDSPDYQKGKGCWITITEFLPGGNGRFLNAQLDSVKFPLVIKISGLAGLLKLPD